LAGIRLVKHGNGEVTVEAARHVPVRAADDPRTGSVIVNVLSLEGRYCTLTMAISWMPTLGTVKLTVPVSCLKGTPKLKLHARQNEDSFGPQYSTPISGVGTIS